jgi:FkbM family methyltransferase
MTRSFPLTLARNLGITRNVAACRPFRPLTRMLSRHKAIPLELLLGAKLDVTFTAQFPGASFLYHAAPEDGLGARFYWQSWSDWEPHVVPVFARYAKTASRILDVGAHTGVYTLFACALNPSLEVFSFEPLPQIHPRLKDNVHVNHFDSRCKLFQIAVSDSPGVASFHVAEDPSMSTLCDNGEIQVRVATLDSLIPLDGRTDLVKMDVEGHEYRALRGMEKIMEDSHPTILFECNPGAPGKQVGELLQSHGYDLFSLVGGVEQKLNELVPERFPNGNHNFLATHPCRETVASANRPVFKGYGLES